MKRCFSYLMILTLAAISMSSCAYMQTHRQIESNSLIYNGFCLKKPERVYYYDGKWYLKAEDVLLSESYPLIHDSVLLKDNNKKTPVVIRRNGESYISISSGTAKVLQMKEGYATLPTLRDEMAQGEHLSLDGGINSYPVRAHIDAAPNTGVYHCYTDCVHQEPGVGTHVLSTASLILVDAPGTVLYNVAIPLMAPIFFFHEFLTEDTSLDNISN